MRRLLIVAVALIAFLAPATFVATPASAGPHIRCPRGFHWMPAHRDRYGKYIRGHCIPN
jgi:hypothetical protein